MKFTQVDVKRLYGNQVFVIDQGEKTDHLNQVESYAIWDASGVVPTWYMKPKSRIALILSKSEFGNKSLTEQLKQCVQIAGVPTDEIGFGMIPDGERSCNCMEMPVNVGVIFIMASNEEEKTEEHNDKYVHVLPMLQSLVTHESGKKALAERIKRLMD